MSAVSRVSGRANCIGVLLAAGLLAGCASNRPVYPEECGVFDAAVPALIEGGLLGAVTGRTTHNRGAGVAAGVATGYAAFSRERDRCLLAVEQRRREQIERTQRAMEYRRQEEARAQREWAQNNRCVTYTTDEFGRRVRDKRECVHYEYGVRY